ncbi:MAG: hypothetical protein WAT69_11305, partial [Trichococcus flocculiformis]
VLPLQVIDFRDQRQMLMALLEQMFRSEISESPARHGLLVQGTECSNNRSEAHRQGIGGHS